MSMQARILGACRAACAALALASGAHAADVDVSLLRMGVGNHVRAGDPTAIRVRATSSLQAPVQARIEWAVRNADGDVALYSRDVALAPGAPADRWLYGVTPILGASARTALDMVTVVRVFVCCVRKSVAGDCGCRGWCTWWPRLRFIRWGARTCRSRCISESATQRR